MSLSSLPPDTALVRQVEMPKELSHVFRTKGLLAYEILSNGAAAGFRDRDIVIVSPEGSAPDAFDRYRQCVARLANLRAWEEDHRVRLSLGGAPYDRYNFWPEARFGTWNAERKDELEGVVHDLVCRGRLTLAQGQAAFLGDWTLAYRRYLGEPRRANVTGAGPTASARPRDERDLHPPPLPPPVKPPAGAAPECVWVWRPTAFGRGPWFFKTCP